MNRYRREYNINGRFFATKRGWSENKRGGFCPKRGWSENKQGGFCSKRGWSENRRGGFCSKRGWSENKRGDFCPKRGWSENKRGAFCPKTKEPSGMRSLTAVALPLLSMHLIYPSGRPCFSALNQRVAFQLWGGRDTARHRLKSVSDTQKPAESGLY